MDVVIATSPPGFSSPFFEARSWAVVILVADVTDATCDCQVAS